MKKLFFSIVALVAAMGVWGQQNHPFMQPITPDPEVRIGQLENGLTYYIRHNEKPKEMANFWIVYNVGAIQEEDDQQGLAHFLEHMAFNGTKNLPGKQLIEYCEKIGVAFGRNLNAATSWDYTTYNLNDVPVKRNGEVREQVIDSMLMILHDWSHFIALEGEEIDSERGVIMEELRMHDGANWRSTMKLIQSLGKDTRYEHRNLIGHLDGLASFPHSAIRNFYEKWYRPELMTFIVVGDVDVEMVENKIKALMADVPASPADAAQKEVIVVPDNQEPIISIYTDPEMQQSQATLYVKHAALPVEMNSLIMAEFVNVVDTYLATMANARLEEISMKPDAPFLGSYMYNGSVGIIPTLETAVLSVTSKEGELPQAFAAAMVELERMRRHGFTESELERAKADLLRQIERQYTNRNDRDNLSFVRKYVSHFRLNQAIPDAETEYQLDKQLVEMITVEMVNGRLQELYPSTNQVVTVTAPEKEGLQNPTEEMIAAILTQIPALPAEAIEPYADDTVKEPLIGEDVQLKGSPVKKSSENSALGATEWTLKNGTRIIVKPTTFKADEVMIYAEANGGAALIENADESAYAQQFLPTIRQMSGVSKFSASDLRKQLSGKSANLSPFVNGYTHGFQGSASPRDLETLMQLVYLNFTAPRFDEGDYKAFYNQYRGYLENMNSNPDYLFSKEISSTVYGGNPRAQVVSTNLLDKVAFDRLDDINATLYPDANEFTFTLVGNVDLEALKPLVEKYIGSIPVSKQKLAFVDDNMRKAKGGVEKEFTAAMQQPKVSLFVCFSGELDNGLKNNLTLTLLTQALSNRYLETVREKMGATYSIFAGGNIQTKPVQEYIVQVACDTNEKQADDVVAAIMAELEKIAQEGPLTDDVEKAREFLLKEHRNNLEQNNAWLSYLQRYYRDNSHVDWVNGYDETLKSITYDEVKALAAKLLADGNRILVAMRPQAAE